MFVRYEGAARRGLIDVVEIVLDCDEAGNVIGVEVVRSDGEQIPIYGPGSLKVFEGGVEVEAIDLPPEP